jgi:chromosome segregation ATPase
MVALIPAPCRVSRAGCPQEKDHDPHRPSFAASLGVMTVPTDVERKVRHLDNDVQAIYEQLTDISGTQRRHTNRLNEIDISLGQVREAVTMLGGRVASVEDKVDTVGGRVAAVEDKVDTVDGRLASVEDKVDTVGGRVAAVEDKVDTVIDLLRSGTGAGAPAG